MHMHVHYKKFEFQVKLRIIHFLQVLDDTSYDDHAEHTSTSAKDELNLQQFQLNEVQAFSICLFYIDLTVNIMPV